MAVFSPTNAKVHFKAYDGSFTDALGNATITQHNSVSMASTQTLFGQESMYMSNFNQAVSFDDPSLFDVGTGDYTVGFWFYPTQFTSYDRLFVTDPYQNASPLRIYNHNGSINVYVESTTDDTNSHDYMMGYSLGNLSGVNNWYHIMVKRDSGTTKLYINGVERSSSTMSYSIASSNTVVLGADTDRGMTGVKGYIQDFFWTEDAISFTQADFTPGTAEPITFHSGNPSISSFSTSAASVANSGDSVTLSWSVSGETKLELLKYVGGILSSTEDVLGLSSKLVTITETVSYKLRATNDNSAVDSASVQITLNGGNSMAKIQVGDNAGLVLQKSMVDSSGGLADVMHAEDPTNGAAEDKLNVVLSNMRSEEVANVASIDTRVGAEEAARAAADTALSGSVVASFNSSNTRIGAEESLRASKDSSLELRLSQEESLSLAEFVSVDTRATGIETGLASEIVDRKADVDAEETRAIAAEGSLELRLSQEESLSLAEFGSVDTRATGIESALAAEVAATNADVTSIDTRVAAEEAARASNDSSLELRLSQEESLSLAEFVSSDARALAVENALAAEVAATNADVTSIDTRVAADEADLALLRSDFEWDSTNKHMIVGGYARVEFESGVASGDPMKITVKGK